MRNPMRSFRFGLLAASFLAFFFLLTGRLSVDARPNQDPSRSPVLIELFTSEGCSDCPPADALLATLDQSQPIAYAQMIVLSEHVDYWDSEGWRDPYSSHDLTTRQEDYAERFHLPSSYTPQMVVNGNAQFVGSDQKAAFAAIEKAASTHLVPIRLSGIRTMGDAHVRVQIDINPPNPATFAGDIWIALADDSDESSVTAGENAGRSLSHVAVVRHLVRIGDVYHRVYSAGGAYYTGEARLHGLRIVAFVQQGSGGKILALGTARLPD